MNRILQFFLKTYILFNFHVAFSVLAIYLILNQDWQGEYAVFILSSTIFSYNFIRLISFGGNRFFIKKFYAQNKLLLKTILISSLILSLYYYWQLDLMKQLILVPLFIITGLYNFEYRNFPKLRDFGLIKILIVAFVWSGLTVLVPQFDAIDKIVLLKSAFVFIYVTLLILSFDQRDLLLDHQDLKTIPMRFSKYLIVIYLILVTGLSLMNLLIFGKQKVYITEFIILLSAILCFRSTHYKSFYYTALLIEALPIFWLILLLVLTL